MNMNSPNDSNQIPILKLMLIFLKAIGAYNETKNILSYLTIISLTSTVLFMVLDVTLNWTGIESLSRATFLPSIGLSSIKAIFIILNTKRIIKIINDLKTFWRPNKFGTTNENKIKKFFQLLTLISVWYITFGYLVCLGMIILPLLNFEQRALLYSDYALCNLKSLFCWIPMYFWQIYVLIFQLCPAVLGFDIIFIIFVAYSMVACKLLKIGLLELNTDDGNQRAIILRQIVKQHDFLMGFINSINNIYNIVMLLQFWCSLWSMILFLYMLVSNGIPPKVGDLIYFGTLYTIIVFQLFLYATGGAIIETRLRNVAVDIFMVNWYGPGRTELRKDLAFMIFRAQRTKILNAGKMSDLNFVLFIETMKNSLSVFTLIWQLTNNE